MSAIFGIYHIDRRPVSEAEIQNMNQALEAHGQDGGGVWKENKVGLGQRLMCYTPEDVFEQQPASVIPQLKIVTDARIDNRPELITALGISTFEAARLPDSAFIVLAYEKWGQDCPQHLIGEFAFAIWDERTKSLFAARSPLGERTLFYHSTAQTFAFATMPVGLLALPFVPCILSEEKIADFLVSTGRERNATFYKDIYHLQPGHQLTLNDAGLKTQCFWEPDLKRKTIYSKDDDYLEAFEELFERVISDSLRSLTPVGVLMSGGLDSASVAASAASIQQERGQRLSAFTEVPRPNFEGPVIRGRYADETPLVQAIAHQYPNIDLNFIRTTGRTLLEDVDRFFDHAEVPFMNVANRPWMETAFQTARNQNVRVLLTGDQGNLTVSWNGSGLIRELMLAGQWKRAFSEARASVRRGDEKSALRVLISQGLMRLLPTQLIVPLVEWRDEREYATTGFDWGASAINPDFGTAQNLKAHLNETGRSQVIQERYAPKESRYLTLTRGGMPSVRTGYRAMFGVEIRNPLADLRIIEFCLSLPETQTRRDGETRWLIRRAMAERLPSEVIKNRKRGIQAADWFETVTASRAEIKAQLEWMEQDERAMRTIDVKRLRRLLDNWPDEDTDKSSARWEYRSTLQSGIMVGAYLRWFGRREQP